MMLLIQLLNDTFRLYYYDSLATADLLCVKNTIYLIDEDSKRNAGFIGFFDWLRSNQATIVGVRICYFENFAYNKILMNRPYVKSTFDNRCMEILFKEGGYNFELSGDQDFTNNFVYKTETGDYLFTFGLDHLTDSELNSLKGCCEVLGDQI